MSASAEAAESRVVVILAVAGLIALLCAANAHLVYVSLASQPDCVPHRRIGESHDNQAYAAAASACSPPIPSEQPRSDR
ncbi:hypothetical protein [Aurantimonas sp. 22II-16-19i]|uniref:hypothetical protein n=1 Tax=Aurantimonas sp. 22II-16-19i TaxID=1317114 RepID=UPI0009F7AA98|nr:hypothetical protein [Aurantimonas sp. 22II-16-19i]ORE91894.1 hypothetical protein ATO4_18294 [Aurantimonas sp. 22II-16-19i]